MVNTILFVLNIITLWMLFEKAGDKGWKALIPYYSFYTVSRHGKCRGLFWTHLILGFFVNIILVVSFVIRAVNVYDMAIAATDMWDFLMAFLTPANILLTLLSITLLILMAALKMRIIYRFTQCFTRETGLLVLSCIGSLPILFIVQVIIRCILAFDEGYQYLGDCDGMAKESTTYDHEKSEE